MHKIFNFDFSNILSKEIDIIHFSYYLIKCSDNQKVFLEKSGIARSSFLLAKKNGFMNSDKLNDKIKEYYKIKLYNENHYSEITNLLKEAYTEAHYDSTGTMNMYYDKFVDIYKQVENTVLEILALIGLCLSYEKNKMQTDISIWIDKIDLLDNVLDNLSSNEKYLVLYSLSTYYTNNSDNVKIIQYCNKIDEITDLAEPLNLLANFCLMTSSRLQGKNLIAIQHLNKASELCDIYYSEYLSQAIRSLRSTLYLSVQEYELCLKYSLADIIRIQREDKFALGYISTLHNISTCYLKLKNYKEALYYMKLCTDYNILDNAHIPKVYYQILETKRQLGYIGLMYIYYKMNDNKSIKDTFDIADINEEIKSLAYCIVLLSNNDMKNFINNLKEIKSIQNKFYFGWIEILEEEFKKYLIDNNKYISIYDMKI